MVPSLFFIMLVGNGGYRWCQVWGESERGKKILKISFFPTFGMQGKKENNVV
jgi:hypothetical protein